MKKLLGRIGFDKAEAQFFAYLYKKLSCDEQKMLDTLAVEFSNGKGVEIANTIHEKLKPLMDNYQLPVETMNLLFLVANLDNMRQKYLANGVGEELFFDTVKDLKYKLDECKKYSGILGVKPLWWYHLFINAEIVALGRFQYHKARFYQGMSYEWNGLNLNADDQVISFHIPSSGPMPREMRMESYIKAFEYFGKTKGEYLVLFCDSWLLYPGYKEVFAEGSNMRDFMDDFDIISEITAEEGTFQNSRSVFGMEYNGDTSKFSTDTTLQRNFIKYLNEGKKTGWGTGVILFDGEKIVNNKRDN